MILHSSFSALQKKMLSSAKSRWEIDVYSLPTLMDIWWLKCEFLTGVSLLWSRRWHLLPHKIEIFSSISSNRTNMKKLRLIWFIHKLLFFFLKFLKQPVLPFSFFLHYLFSYTLFLFKYLFLHSLSFYLSYLSFTSILFPLTHLLPIIFFLGKRTLYSLVYLLLLLHKLSF